jgi:prophage regulatory protein
MRLMRLSEVMECTGMGRSTLFAAVREGTFPPPVEIGPQLRGFVDSEVDAWIEEKIKQRDAQLAAKSKVPAAPVVKRGRGRPPKVMPLDAKPKRPRGRPRKHPETVPP